MSEQFHKVILANAIITAFGMVMIPCVGLGSLTKLKFTYPIGLIGTLLTILLETAVVIFGAVYSLGHTGRVCS